MKATHLVCILLTSVSLLFGACAKHEPHEEHIAKSHREHHHGSHFKIKKTALHGEAKDKVQTGLASKPFKYTSKAACQIKCGNFTLEEIKTVVGKGKLVKYDTKNEQITCPLYALEHTLPGKGKVLVLTADCKDVTKIVRVVLSGTNCPNC